MEVSLYDAMVLMRDHFSSRSAIEGMKRKTTTVVGLGPSSVRNLPCICLGWVWFY